jgi:glucose/arabinose dehydrogenase
VSAAHSDNAFRIAPDGSVAKIAGPEGAGEGHGLEFSSSVAVDAAGVVYVGGNNSGNVLRVRRDGRVEEVMGASFEGRPLGAVMGLAVAPDGSLYAARLGPEAVFRLAPDGRITRILDEKGAGDGRLFKSARAVVVDRHGAVYISGLASDEVLKVVPAAASGAPRPAGAAAKPR